MTLRIYNTLSNSIEEFHPIQEGKVKMFVCGPTVYDDPHLGHARTYSFFDVLVRFLKFSGYEVFYVMNVTDVGHLTEEGEDKIIKRAGSLGKHPMEIADYYVWRLLEAMDKLRIARPSMMPRATGHIPEIIEQVSTLINKGYAYISNGSVYFDVSKFKDYGKLSHKKIEELLPGARVEINPEKKDPRDFALWIKAEKSHIMKWNSPWSVGYPGWHIEDTAIALKYLGSQYDIHGGGIDLVFPHHEAEIAQAEATTGIKPYVKYWIHTGFLTIRGEKMAKSLGNFIVIFDLLEKYRAEAIRLYLSSTHFRKPLDFDEKELDRAENRINDLVNNILAIDDAIKDGGGNSSDISFVYDLKNKFVDAMEDNMNTPLALQVFFKLLENLASKSSGITLNKLIEAKQETTKLSDIFKIVTKESTIVLSEEIISILIEIRNKLRAMGNYQLADEIREKLKNVGIALEDTKSGTKWKIIRG
ncbi:MAG: cysteine--tRNA ligase [Candidatus Brockarchaeota archaeon]|nr:cysteine--tRNA ligase [Candidatus Brockarchaeota archaeon]